MYRYEQKQLDQLESKERELLNRIDDLEKVASDDHQWRMNMREKLVMVKMTQHELEKKEK